MVRDVAREVLGICGYRVLDALHGADALRVAERHAGPIHLLLADVVMPGMSGRELAERLTRLHPETRVLYMSGHPDDTVLQRGVSAAEADFIQKPFTLDALARKAREVLTRGIPAA